MELSGYQIIEPIGRDDHSESYLAKQSDSGKRVVIKCWHKASLESEDLNETIRVFLSDGEYASQISHPNIANICAVGETNDTIYCINDYICGDALEARAAQMCLLDKIYVIKEIAGALDYLASKNIHVQTVCPSSILLTTDQSRPCLIDIWQYQKVFNREESVSVEDDKTILSYMSPEQIAAGVMDIRSNLYNLGMILYYLLAGKSQSMALAKAIGENKNIGESVAQLPSHLSLFQDIIDTAVAADPENRFQSGKDFIRELEQISDEEIILLDGDTQSNGKLEKEALAVPGISNARGNNGRQGSNVIALPVVNRNKNPAVEADCAIVQSSADVETEVHSGVLDQTSDIATQSSEKGDDGPPLNSELEAQASCISETCGAETLKKNLQSAFFVSALFSIAIVLWAGSDLQWMEKVTESWVNVQTWVVELLKRLLQI